MRRRGGDEKRSASYRVELKGEDKLWSRLLHTKTRSNAHINICPETFNV
jgi:hypothetical protein